MAFTEWIQPAPAIDHVTPVEENRCRVLRISADLLECMFGIGQRAYVLDEPVLDLTIVRVFQKSWNNRADVSFIVASANFDAIPFDDELPDWTPTYHYVHTEEPA